MVFLPHLKHLIEFLWIVKDLEFNIAEEFEVVIFGVQKHFCLQPNEQNVKKLILEVWNSFLVGETGLLLYKIWLEIRCKLQK